MGKNLFFVLETEKNEQAHAIAESKLKLLQMCISVHLLHLLILQEAFFRLPNRSFYANTSFKMCCSDLVTGDKQDKCHANSVAIKRGSIMSCLRLPSASWIDPGFLGAGGGRGIDLCVRRDKGAVFAC